MRNEEPSRYAARLNSFRVGAEDCWPNKNRITTADLLQRAATVDGLNAADLNYPDHFDDTSPRELAAVLDRLDCCFSHCLVRSLREFAGLFRRRIA